MEVNNKRNAEGNITAGTVQGLGMGIAWQDGPIDAALGANGALVDDVLWAAQQRLEAYQDTGLRCRENALAITKIEEARHWLAARQADRTKRGVEGTYQP